MTPAELLEKIAAAPDLATEAVAVPAWGVTLLLRELTFGERMEFAAIARSDAQRLPAWLVAHGMTPQADLPTADMAHAEAVLNGKGKVIESLAETVMRLSGMDIGAADTEKN
jgi:hypothetical protein